MAAEASKWMVLSLALCRRHTHTMVLWHTRKNTDFASLVSGGVRTEHNCAREGAVASKLFVATAPVFVATVCFLLILGGGRYCTELLRIALTSNGVSKGS